MSIEWTKDQRTAIEIDGGTVLVSAGAGSGKTAVLVERVLRMLTQSEPVEANRLLMITFTRAAAAEMRRRILQGLKKLQAQRPGDALLRRQSVALQRAQISTVHSFCTALLREYFAKLELPADFYVADDMALLPLREAAMAETLDEMYARSAAFRELSSLYGRARSDEPTAQLVEELRDYQTSIVDKDAYRRRVMAFVDGRVPFENSDSCAILLAHAARQLGEADVILARAQSLMARDERANTKCAANVAALRAAVQQMAELARQGRYAECASYEFTLPRLGGGKKENDTPAVADVTELRDAALETVKRVRQQCLYFDPDWYAQQSADLSGPVAALFEAAARFDELFAEKKLARRMLEFSDLEKYTLQLLGDAEVAAEISARFECVMVDEYQDTNEMQSAIFRAVSRGDNLFYVGDVKQSIYSFRQARPANFLEQKRACEAAGKDSFPMCVQLAENFRSTAEVIAAVNRIFVPLMTPTLGEVDYAAGEQLVCGSGAHSDGKVGMELAILRGDEQAGIEKEALFIAARIGAMVKDAYTVNGADGPRRCTWGDFCILLRSPYAGGRAQIYAAALKSAGIPVSTSGAESFFEHAEIRDLIDALRVVDNPLRDVELTALLCSCRFGFSTDDLLRLRKGGRKVSLWSLLRAATGEKERAAVAFVDEMRAQSALMSADELAVEVAQRLGIERAAAAMPGGADRVQNLHALLDFAAGQCAQGQLDLSGLLRICERARSAGKSPAGSGTPAADAVCIMSIHAAKGLEWPVVFLANTAAKFNEQGLNAPMIFDSELGVGSKLRVHLADDAAIMRRTSAYGAVVLEQRRKQRSDEMRMLYVALTRARDYIVAVAVENAPEKRMRTAQLMAECEYAERLESAGGSYCQWLLCALSAGGVELSSPDGRRELCETVINVVDSVPQLSLPAAQARPAADKKTVGAVLRRLNWRCDDAALFNIPGKMSVSQLTKRRHEPTVGTPAFTPAAALSAAERGTALHEFMEFADYAQAAVSVDAELERLVEKGYISAAAADAIDRKALETLFAGDFMRRINAAPQVLREYEFFYELPAARLVPDCEYTGGETVLVQGIADCIVVEKDGVSIVDYKSDRVTGGAQLCERYAAQLQLYALAISERLALPVKAAAIWSFALGKAVAVPIEEKAL